MLGFRFRVGGDWSTYRDIFSSIGVMDLADAVLFASSDPAYSLLNWVAHQFGSGIWFVNLCCGAVLIWGIASIAWRQPNPWLVFLVAVPYLIIVVGMGYTRQAAAIGLTLVAITSLIRGDLRKFIIAMVIATLFHKSAIILLPVVGLAWTRDRWIMAGLVAMIGALLYYFFISASLESLTTNYLKAQLNSEGAAVRVAMNAFPAAVYLLGQRKFGFSELERRIWRNLSIAALLAILGLMFLPSSTVVERLPWALSGGPAGRMILTMLVVIYSAGIQFVWLTYALHSRLWIPYRIYPLL
jgi:hypothetical protein